MSAMRNVARAELGLPLDEPFITETPNVSARVLTEEFAGRVNRVGGLLPDETKIEDLRVFTEITMAQYRNDQRQAYYDSLNTPKEWYDFLNDLDPLERGRLTSSLGRILRKYRTVGEVRQASIAEMKRTVPDLTAEFTKRAFQPVPTYYGVSGRSA